MPTRVCIALHFLKATHHLTYPRHISVWIIVGANSFYLITFVLHQGRHSFWYLSSCRRVVTPKWFWVGWHTTLINHTVQGSVTLVRMQQQVNHLIIALKMQDNHCYDAIHTKSFDRFTRGSSHMLYATQYQSSRLLAAWWCTTTGTNTMIVQMVPTISYFQSSGIWYHHEQVRSSEKTDMILALAQHSSLCYWVLPLLVPNQNRFNMDWQGWTSWLAPYF
jgi:hypothetical protein